MIMFDSLMEQVIDRENQGDYKAAVRILEEATVTAFSNKALYSDLLYELSMLFFRNGSYYLALVKLIELYYLHKNDELLTFIIDAYVSPNMERYHKNYINNIRLLENYSFIYSDLLPDFKSMEFIIIWEDDEKMIYYAKGEFVEQKYTTPVLHEDVLDKTLLITNAHQVKFLLTLEKQNKKYDTHLTKEVYRLNPIYLYYNTFDFLLFLCMNEIDDVIKQERFVFLIEQEKAKEFFGDYQAIIPNYLIQKKDGDIMENPLFLFEERQKKEHYFEKYGKELLIHYYEQEKENIVERIRLGKPKLLFITSRLSTIIQYHTRDFCNAAVKKGLEAYVLIDKSQIHCSLEMCIWELIDKKKPDIIVCIDHFRYEISACPFPSMIFLTWVQDPLPCIMDKNSPEKLQKNDFLLNHFITWKEFFDVGYDTDKIIDAPVPANQDIYKHYELSKIEKDRYSCDICFVCHSSVIHDFIESEREQYDSIVMKDVMTNLYLSYYKQVLEQEEIYYERQEFRDYVNRYFAEECNICLTDEESDILTEKMYFTYAPKVYRQVMVEWILDAGYYNIKLWGHEWGKEEKFIPYAMGAAENGEELSKIYQASKINIGNNNLCTVAARVWETMLSGGFYLSNYVPEKADTVNIRKILDPEDFVMFRSKSEMLEKIDYYLSHEQERIEMAEKGRKKALEKMTFDALLDHTLHELKEKIS